MENGLQLSSKMLCRKSGASYRQVDWWCRHGVLRDPGPVHGRHRRFTKLDLRVTKIIQPLATLHCPLTTLQNVARVLYEQLPTREVENGYVIVRHDSSVVITSSFVLTSNPVWVIPF